MKNRLEPYNEKISLQGPVKIEKLDQADEEIRTLDPLLGKEMLYH